MPVSLHPVLFIQQDEGGGYMLAGILSGLDTEIPVRRLHPAVEAAAVMVRGQRLNPPR